MSLWGAIGGFVLGGPIGAGVGAVASNYLDGEDKPAAQNPYPPPVDYSAAMMVASDNAKATALAQIMTQKFAMQRASMDRQMQLAASLELGLEKFDAKLQTAKLDYFARMHSEENRHVEKMTGPQAASRDADFPEPSLGD